VLELRPNCECCNKDLPPAAADAKERAPRKAQVAAAGPAAVNPSYGQNPIRIEDWDGPKADLWLLVTPTKRR
jgi:hypothetical protein